MKNDFSVDGWISVLDRLPTCASDMILINIYLISMLLSIHTGRKYTKSSWPNIIFVALIPILNTITAVLGIVQYVLEWKLKRLK